MKLTLKMIRFLKTIETIPLKPSIHFHKLYSLRNIILKNALSYGYDEYDLNKIISSKTFKINSKNKKTDDNILEKLSFLKELCYLFHKMIAINSTKSKFWDGNIKDLQQYVEKKLGQIIPFNLINDAFIKLLNKSISTWSGFWDLIDYSSRGEIKKIETFDYDDKETVKKYVSGMIKK